MQNKFKATTALLISAAGAVLTLPNISPFTMDSFTLGLFNHGFLAATIGGLADWFAVTALFRKPLGFISYRTEILKRNRQRIMEAIVDFVSSDLLSAKNIVDNIKSESTANLLIAYFERNDGREKIKSLINETLIEIATTADTKSIAKSLTPIIKSEAQNIDANQIIDVVVKIVTKEEHSRQILTNIFEALHNIFKSEPIQESMKNKIENLRKEYESDSPGRALVLNALNLTDEKILTIISENVDKKITGTIKTLIGTEIDPNTITTAANLTMYFKNFLQGVTSDENTQKFFSDMKTVLANNFDFADYVKNWLDIYLKSKEYLENQKKIKDIEDTATHIIKVEKVRPIWQNAIENVVDSKIDEFIKSPVLQDKFDRFVKNLLEKIINNYHHAIPGMIRERLDKLTDDELTKFVEEKVSDDLQMIRINGSICGGFVGIVLYLISYGIKFATGNL